MASLTLKNIPDDLLERLKLVAEQERRSMTQQVLYILEKDLAERQPEKPTDATSDAAEERP